MKKLLYSVAALALLAGCAKDVNEIAPVVKEKGGLTLNLTVVEDDTRAVFDGDSHIAWEKGDKLGIIATQSADDVKGENNFGYGVLTIADETAEKPVFTGTVDLDSDLGETVYIAGLYPFSAVGSTSNRMLTDVEIKLAATQTPSQTSWDGAADVMLMKQTQVTAKQYSSGYDSWEGIYYYKWTADAEITFAHIFGFGCIEFGTLPEDLAGETVSKVTITATGETKNIAGTFKVDLNKDVFSSDFAVADGSTLNIIALTCDGSVALKDFKGWFVANPGTYDVTINVATSGHNILFERKGLKIERSKIAKPVINFKDGDVVESTDIDLTGGKLWQHDTEKAYEIGGENQFFKQTDSTADWGTNEGVKTMTYALAFSENPTNYGKYYNFKNRAVQSLSNTSVSKTGNITITSISTYKGIEGIKVNAGNAYTWDLGTKSCDITAAIIDNKGVEHTLGAAQHITNTGVNKGTDYYFSLDADTPSEGIVKITFDNFSDTSSSSSYLYLGLLSVNPEPGISFEADALELAHKACSGTTNVSVVCAKEAATVTTDVDWLKATIADGVISYTAEANTAAEKREGHIIVSAKGNGESSKSLTVYQYSVIDLTGGKLWQHNTHTASNGGDSEGRFFTSQSDVATWGTLADLPTADFKLYCVSNGSYATTVSPSASKVGDIYTQKMSVSNFRTGEVIIESKNAFNGINNIKVHGGMSSGTDTCDIEVYAIGADGTKTQIGETQTLGGSPANPNGADVYFDAANAPVEGQIQIVMSNCTVNSCYNLFISELDVNPAPAITFAAENVSIGGNGGSGDVGVTIVCATGEPTVSSDVDWLKVSYKDGIISYTADANTGDDTRIGHIIIEATGNSTSSASLTVSQLSDKVVEFKLAFSLVPDESDNANKLIAAIEKAAELVIADGGTVSAGTTLNVTTTLTATATDGSGITRDVELYFDKITYESIDRKQIRMNGGYSSANRGHICNTESLGMFTTVTISNSSYSDGGYSNYNTVYFGTSLDDLHSATKEKINTDSPYVWVSKTSEANNYGFFKMQQEYVNYIYAIELTFIAKK